VRGLEATDAPNDGEGEGDCFEGSNIRGAIDMGSPFSGVVLRPISDGPDSRNRYVSANDSDHPNIGPSVKHRPLSNRSRESFAHSLALDVLWFRACGFLKTMDVRCDRCETEYELDDGSVSDTGTSVQCTTCGHRFIVTRRPSSPLNQVALTPPGGSAKLAEPDVPDWTLSTDDGKVHRFRDLNTLQKWIVERKATRSDRLSRAGGPWLALDDIEELSSFFRVVDEADRARGPSTPSPAAAPVGKAVATAPPARGPSGSAPHPTTRAAAAGHAGTPPPIPFDARQTVSSDGPTVPNRRLPAAQPDAEPPARPARRTPGLGLPGAGAGTPTVPAMQATLPKAAAHVPSRPNPMTREPSSAHATLLLERDGTDDLAGLDGDFLMPRHRGRNVAVVLVLLAGLGGAGGYYWHTQRARADGSGGVVASPPPPATAAGGGDKAPVAIAPTEAAGPGHAPESASAEHPAEKPAPEPAAEVPAPVAAAKAPAAGPHPKAAATAARSVSSNAAASGYDHLVSEGDRLLERGQAARAEKLYTQALAAKPDGAGALTGLAYVLLERQRHFKAIEMFRRVLDSQPTYGPALFGIAESYRARGDTAQALAAYRQYMVISPSGADAPAARRQIKDLESASPQASSTRKDLSAPPAQAGE